MITSVDELISALAKYPKNMKVYSNHIVRNFRGELVIEHQRTLEEERAAKKAREEFYSGRYQEEMDRVGETSFASRW